MRYAVIKDLHTFFSDMRFTPDEASEMLEHYRTFAPPQYLPETTQELLDILINFRRRLFKPKNHRFFAD